MLDTQPGTKGLIGVGGPQPVGYYKDAEKSARTFVETAHGRFSVPGDWAVVNDDGVTLTVLGRGSVCINTGGEKVFPEEVEEVIKRYPGITDAVVVGVPDEKWGEAITAVVSTTDGRLDAAGAEAVREAAPRRVQGAEAMSSASSEVYRSPSGKADFKRTKAGGDGGLGAPLIARNPPVSASGSRRVSDSPPRYTRRGAARRCISAGGLRRTR